MLFYVYEWFIKETGEIIYVGKGCRNRYKVRKHNRFFNDMISRFECESQIVKYFQTEIEAFEYEYELIRELKLQNQCACNIYDGGTGGTVSWWDDNRRKIYSEKNVMKSESQRRRMSEKNPMKNPNYVQKMAKRKLRKVVINGAVFDGVKIAAQELNVQEQTVSAWCKRGYDTSGNPCRYYDEEQKQFDVSKILKNANKRRVVVDNKVYESVQEAANFIGCAPETLIRALKSNRKCKNHSCRYDNQHPSCGNFGNSTAEGSTTNR